MRGGAYTWSNTSEIRYLVTDIRFMRKHNIYQVTNFECAEG